MAARRYVPCPKLRTSWLWTVGLRPHTAGQVTTRSSKVAVPESTCSLPAICVFLGRARRVPTDAMRADGAFAKGSWVGEHLGGLDGRAAGEHGKSSHLSHRVQGPRGKMPKWLHAMQSLASDSPHRSTMHHPTAGYDM